MPVYYVTTKEVHEVVYRVTADTEEDAIIAVYERESFVRKEQDLWDYFLKDETTVKETDAWQPEEGPALPDTTDKEGLSIIPRGYQRLSMNHEHGHFYYSELWDVSVFEDNQLGEDQLRYYAWSGDWRQHDTAEHSPAWRLS